MLLSERFTEALTFAARLHAGQIRKGSGVPYVAHLLGVASLVLEYGGTEEEAIAALLHDAIEDCGGIPTREEIRRRFGDGVTAIVEGCSDALTQPKPPWRDRKKRYLQHLETATQSVLLVAAADKLYNARSLLKDYQRVGEDLWQRFTGGKEGTLWYYRALVEGLGRRSVNPLVRELADVVAALEVRVGAGEFSAAERGRAIAYNE